jgi:transglutaminase-like putative cysteine protease
LLLAGVVAIWAAMFSCHALAFRAGSPLLALLPPLALLTFADTVLEELIKPQYGLLFLVGALAIVFADALRRVQGWGPVWVPAGSRARLASTAGRGARRVAVAAIATAAIIPALVPGFGSKAIIDISSTSSSDHVRIDPLVSIRAALSRDEPVEVFRVSSSVPSYWRMVSLPTFDGAGFKPDNSAEGEPITPDTILPTGPSDQVGTQTLEQVFQVSGDIDLDLPWLPAAYLPQRIDAPNLPLRFDPESGAANLSAGLSGGTVYHVTSVVPQPTPEQLETESMSTGAVTRYTALPTDTLAEIRPLAERWTQGAINDYQRVLMIQNRLSDTAVFTYDKTVPARDDTFTLMQFLTVTKAGFCQQFASAMAVMLRSIGIPTRVVMGFTAGQYDPDTGTRVVTTSELHSWVEVLSPTYGWLTFDPTPGRANPSTATYSDPSDSCPPGARTCLPSSSQGGTTGAGGTVGNHRGLPSGLLDAIGRENIRAGRGLRRLRGSETGAEPVGSRSPRRTVLLIFAALLAFAALVIPPARALRRRARIRRQAGRPRALVLATYDVFTERAADLGYARAAGETLDEYRHRLGSSGALPEGRLDRLTSIAVHAAYGADDPMPAEVDEVTDAAHTAIHDLRRQAGLKRRIAGQYRIRR